MDAVKEQKTKTNKNQTGSGSLQSCRDRQVEKVWERLYWSPESWDQSLLGTSWAHLTLCLPCSGLMLAKAIYSRELVLILLSNAKATEVKFSIGQRVLSVC